MKIIVHAPNVHQGGGRTLLIALLEALDGVRSTAILDERFAAFEELPKAIDVVAVHPTVMGRFIAEKKLASISADADLIICFGNLPPLFKTSGKVFVFLQNRYLLNRRGTRGFPISQRCRIEIERFWLRWRLGNASLIVQSESMAREAGQYFKRNCIRVMPFVSDMLQKKVRSENADLRYDYLYVASGEPHKNHLTLVDAWEILGEDGLFPSLALTIDELQYAQLAAHIRKKSIGAGLKIINLGVIPRHQMPRIYAESNSLIYPSLFESYGLPLIEAFQAGLPIVAAELDYVRDVSDPVSTFDPTSAMSIARAVKRHLYRDTILSPMTSREFLNKILNTKTYPEASL